MYGQHIKNFLHIAKALPPDFTAFGIFPIQHKRQKLLSARNIYIREQTEIVLNSQPFLQNLYNWQPNPNKLKYPYLVNRRSFTFKQTLLGRLNFEAYLFEGKGMI